MALFLLMMSMGIMLVKADGLNIEYALMDGKYHLNLTTNEGKNLTYDEALNKGLIEETIELYIDNRSVYFIKGLEVSKEEYQEKYANNEADKLASSYGEYGLRVHNAEEIINAIKNIYDNRLSNEYHLVYSTLERERINFETINTFLKENYMSDIEQNAYRYVEYGIRQPIKYLPIYNSSEVVINGGISKISESEEKIVNQFLDTFDNQMQGKSDYEKIVAIYNYLKKTVQYETDDGYINFQDGLLSPYDTLIKRKGVCIGLATTFQFLAERYQIESYIIDRVADVDEKTNTYSTIHTYNIVKLNDLWYIIDINSNEDNFLISSTSGKYDAKDLKYLNIELANKDYLEEHPNLSLEDNLNYQVLDSKVKELNNIKVNNEVVQKEDAKTMNNNNDLIAYIVLVLILFSIFMVVLWFTKKK